MKKRIIALIKIIIIFGLFYLLLKTLSPLIPKKKTDVDLVNERLEEFSKVEEICGIGNVRNKCNYGYCDNSFGFTCNMWSKAKYTQRLKEK